MGSYVTWANKGGIGKSTLTFQLACSTARNHPDKTVYVIDLSPQCDVSRMILGGGHNDGEDTILRLMQSNPRRTVQTYLANCLNDVPTGNGWPDPQDYVIDPATERQQQAQDLPPNLRLMCGDFDLERTIQLIEQLPQPPRRSGRAPTGPEFSSFLLPRSFIRHAVNELRGDADNIVLIDTDPYFSVITTHMGLAGADAWITAYSPNSQASQYAVLRSVEFMFEPNSGLMKTITDEEARFPRPWFDNRGNPLDAPNIAVAMPYLLLANMANPFSRAGQQGYTDPQRLQRDAITAVNNNVRTETGRYGVRNFLNTETMWDMRRLGLICDYNGIDLPSLELGENYYQPGNVRYHLNTTGGTPDQLRGYTTRLNTISTLLQ